MTLASGQPCAIEVEKDGSKVAGTSIMGLMMLGAAMGDHVTISTAGDGAEQALTLLVELVEASSARIERSVDRSSRRTRRSNSELHPPT